MTNRNNCNLTETEHKVLLDLENALKLAPDDSEILYFLACFNSLSNQVENSLDYLNQAIIIDECYKNIAREDSDFDNIRSDPRFKSLTN